MTTTEPKKVVNPNLIDLAKDMSKIQNNKATHDVEVTLNGKTYFSHKLIMIQW